MDILKKELDRKRKQIEETNLVSDKKFFRRGDLANYQKEQYWKKHNAKHANDLIVPSTSSNETILKEVAEDKEEKHMLPRDEAIRRLRDKNAPIRLFGETDGETCNRLHKIEIEAADTESGLRNDLQEAMHRVDDEMLREIIEGPSNDKKHDVIVDNETISYNELLEATKALGKEDCNKDCELIYQFLNFVIQKWGRELNLRPEEEKRSTHGKLIQATYNQTAEYLKPLLKSLKTKTCGADIREHMVNVCTFLLKRDYIQANNCYMEMAIGNAPWPVGVTASGIHKRPGSEKLYVRNVAHVLNDETQRKYIQAVKRLMTRCQVYFTTDPSRCVEYRGIGND